MMLMGARSESKGMQLGKGTKDFDAYVRNLHRAYWLQSVGAQLVSGQVSAIRGALVVNPYSKTIADLNICKVRSEAPL